MPGPTDINAVDGSLDFSGGVNSIKVTTVASDLSPGGLKRNELAWLINGTVRDGGISPRSGWKKIVEVGFDLGFYQGGYLYEPDGATPYIVCGFGGNIWKIDPLSFEVTNLSDEFELTMPPVQRLHFCQAEKWLIIQAGDNVTLPLFWDGSTLRQSLGIIGRTTRQDNLINEIPAAGAMDYFMGRLWYAQGRKYCAGDIVGNTNSGTPEYQYRDSVLCVTENPLAIGGDGFTVPTNAGDIRAIKHNATLDTALGEGRLMIFTRKEIYSLSVPVTRSAWIEANANNMPLQTVVQMVNGAVNDSSIVAVNGDLFYQSLEPGIRSLINAIRYFDQWGNMPISADMDRILRLNDRSLLFAASGIVFNNRMLQTALPERTDNGIVHRALCVMDFLPISSFRERRDPNWEGIYEGADILQLFSGDYGGLERAFMLVVSQATGGIELWEISYDETTDLDDRRLQWYVEFPAFTWGSEFTRKRLTGGALWIDNVIGTVDLSFYYRSDGCPCWFDWWTVQKCSPRDVSETPLAEFLKVPENYPFEPYAAGHAAAILLPRPKASCMPMCDEAVPSNVGYQFQVAIRIEGYCRIRGLLLYAEPVIEKIYGKTQTPIVT